MENSRIWEDTWWKLRKNWRKHVRNWEELKGNNYKLITKWIKYDKNWRTCMENFRNR